MGSVESESTAWALTCLVLACRVLACRVLTCQVPTCRALTVAIRSLLQCPGQRVRQRVQRVQWMLRT